MRNAQKAYSTFDGAQHREGLPALCLELLGEQIKTWPALRQAYRSLKQARERLIQCKGFSALLQHNPGRITSSLARVSEEDIANRQCFLCSDHLPVEQRWILYRSAYLILCNPAPVFSAHFTISRVDHQPQAVSEHVTELLQLMSDFGSGWAILYNGPRCGASAPDHLHFQAIPAGRMPIEKAIERTDNFSPCMTVDNVAFARGRGLGREIIVVEGGTAKSVGKAFTGFLIALKKVLDVVDEPMINVAGFRLERTWRLVLFPRRKHRPDAFFKTGDAKITVSPAVIEMGGVLVTPVEKDFERLDAAAVESIYEEVSLEANSVERAVDAMSHDSHTTA